MVRVRLQARQFYLQNLVMRELKPINPELSGWYLVYRSQLPDKLSYSFVAQVKCQLNENVI
jgi:hypothetical protein